MNQQLASFTQSPRARVLAWGAFAFVMAAAPWIGLDAYWTRQVILVALLALVASSLSLSFGFAGELSLGQAAMYAAGAYTSGWMAIHVVNDLVVCALAGIVVALVVGLVAGIPGLRLGGWALAITSLFAVLLIPDVVSVIPRQVLGGPSGLTGIPLPAVFGIEMDQRQFYVAVVVSAVAWFAIFRNLVRSRHGSALLVLRQSPLLASSLGFSIFRLKLTAYALGAIPAGLAGVMFANLSGFVAPESFTLDYALVVLAACIIGGATSVYGVVTGAAILQLGPLRTDTFADYSMVAYGVLLLIGGVFFRNGIAGLVRSLWEARQGPAAAKIPGSPITADHGDIDITTPGDQLHVSGVRKSFGGNAAVQGVDFTATSGQITALIGPNGSGKTTVLNLICGYYELDQGTITLGTTRLDGQRAYQISRKGVARTFQTPVIPEDLSVHECLMTSRTTRARSSMLTAALRLPSYLRQQREDTEAVDQILHGLGIWDKRNLPASSLSVGTRRVVELGRAISAEPRVILLDEIASGLDVDEISALGHMLRRLRDGGATIVLVEHNFALVRSVADHVVVLAEGQVLASGSPADIEQHEEVLAHYLGRGVEYSGTSVSADERQQP